MTSSSVEIRLFAEGVRIPVIGFTRQQVPNRPYTFSVYIPATPKAFTILPGTFIQIFARQERLDGSHRFVVVAEGHAGRRAGSLKGGRQTIEVPCQGLDGIWAQAALGLDAADNSDQQFPRTRLKKFFLGLSSQEGDVEIIEGQAAAEAVKVSGMHQANILGNYLSMTSAFQRQLILRGAVTGFYDVIQALYRFGIDFHRQYNASKMGKRIAYLQNPKITEYLSNDEFIKLVQGRVAQFPADATLLSLAQHILPYTLHHYVSIASPVYNETITEVEAPDLPSTEDSDTEQAETPGLLSKDTDNLVDPVDESDGGRDPEQFRLSKIQASTAQADTTAQTPAERIIDGNVVEDTEQVVPEAAPPPSRNPFPSNTRSSPLSDLYRDPRVRAFLDTIALPEVGDNMTSNSGDQWRLFAPEHHVARGYYNMQGRPGNRNYSSLAQHPGIQDAASGRYQFVASTWRGLVMINFSAQSQDMAAIKLLRSTACRAPDLRPGGTKKGAVALEYILQNRPREALRAASAQWEGIPSDGRRGNWVDRSPERELHTTHYSEDQLATYYERRLRAWTNNYRVGAPPADTGALSDDDVLSTMSLQFVGPPVREAHLPSMTIKPLLPFAPPPKCNVFFESTIAEASPDDTFGAAPTRLLMTTLDGWNALVSSVAPQMAYLTGYHVAPRYLQKIVDGMRSGAYSDISTDEGRKVEEEAQARFENVSGPAAEELREFLLASPNLDPDTVMSAEVQEAIQRSQANQDVLAEALAGGAGGVSGLLGAMTYEELFRGIQPLFASFPFQSGPSRNPDSDGLDTLKPPVQNMRIREGAGEFLSTRQHGAHKALDLLGDIGDPVFASEVGTVQVARESGDYGKWVQIEHDNGLVTRYAHLSVITVSQGARVARGAKIGEMGRSGNASGNDIPTHVHFEVRRNGARVNPRDYLGVPLDRRGPSEAEPEIRAVPEDEGSADAEVSDAVSESEEAVEGSVEWSKEKAVDSSNEINVYTRHRFAVMHRQGRTLRLSGVFTANPVIGYPGAYYDRSFGWIIGEIFSIQDQVIRSGVSRTTVTLGNCAFLADYDDPVWSRIHKEADAEFAELDEDGLPGNPVFYDDTFSKDNIGEKAYGPILGSDSIIDYAKSKGVKDVTIRKALDFIRGEYNEAHDRAAYAQGLAFRPVATEGQVMQSVMNGKPVMGGELVDLDDDDLPDVEEQTHDRYHAPYAATTMPDQSQSFMAERTAWALRLVADLKQRGHAIDVFSGEDAESGSNNAQ